MNVEDVALRYGVQVENKLIDGHQHKVPHETLERLLVAFGAGDGVAAPKADFTLGAPATAKCFLPDPLTRMWGIAVQLYQLRSQRNWGIGDFADLAALAEMAAAEGADFIGLNPLHALFLSNPDACSPFSPSNRRFLNPLYIAVDQVPGYARSDLLDPDALAQVRQGDLVDYAAVARLKIPALRALWGQQRQPSDSFNAFRAAGGQPLLRHALFEAISEHLTAKGHGAGWRSWPKEWQDVDGDAVRTFASDNPDAVTFHIWLQWLADQQLEQAREACRAAGMRIGLYLDFAVGEAPDGSGTWSDRAMVVPGVHVGAPPDWFDEQGQNWGLAPLSPVAMIRQQAAPFRALIEDATRRADALRIDHAMGLWQLFLIPEGMTAAEGTYARYPCRDMLTALAQASQKQRTIVIGEDLGNVPEGFRDVMEEVGILSYRILLFEQTDAGFIPPQDYPLQALVCLSTHDLPTFQGWWRGDDVMLRGEHGAISEQAVAEQTKARARERRDLLRELAHQKLLAMTRAVSTNTDAASLDLVIAAHALMARTPSLLFAARLEDLAGERAPVNLPGTTDSYPNWRRKLGVTLENLPESALFQGITAAIRAERPAQKGAK